MINNLLKRSLKPGSEQNYGFAALLLIFGITVFYLFTIREGHNWGDDFSQYIIHARNMVNGVAYKNTGHIINKVYNIAPETYPPVFPLLLAPVYYFFGLHLQAFKVICILTFAGFLGGCFVVFRKFISDKYAIVIIAFIGLNPYCWDLKDSVLSEFPFLLFAFLTFTVVLYVPEKLPFWKGVGWYLMIGVIMYLAIGSRSVGIILLPAFVLHEFFRKPKARFWPLYMLISVLVCGLLLFFQKIYLNSKGEGYTAQLEHYYQPDKLSENLEMYAAEFTNFLTGSEVTATPGVLNEAVFLILGIAACLGFLMACRNKITILEVFVIGYLASVIIWPMFQGMRLLIPFMPLFLFYLMVFVQNVPFYKLQVQSVFQVLFGVLIFGFLVFFRTANYQQVKWSLFTPDTKELLSFVSYTPESAIFLFDKPRALTLFTNRVAGINHCTDNPDDLGVYIKEINASYLIIYQSDQSCAIRFAGNNPAVSQKVFENKTYVVYKFSDEFKNNPSHE